MLILINFLTLIVLLILNLIDPKNYDEIFDNLKDEKFLKKFGEEPLFKKRPNLEKEINFIKNILN